MRECVPNNRHMFIVYAALIHIQISAFLHAGQGSHDGSSVVLHLDLSEINILRVKGHGLAVEPEAVREMHPRDGFLQHGNEVPAYRGVSFIA